MAVAVAAGLVAGTVANAKSGRSAAPSRPTASPTAQNLCPLPKRYRAAFEAAARDTNLPLALLVSVASVESNLDHGARSAAGARGLLQVMPPTAAELRLDPNRIDTNVLAGARYLKLMMGRFDSADLALAAYNAGPTAVERFGGAPGAETITYVANVNRLWQRLQGCS
ncbi:MAG TPA: lytic transglycosylase domain-containing protein [Gaiellaceae bacterium]|jgi:soluble lytic murein transglycosylase-like protein